MAARVSPVPLAECGKQHDVLLVAAGEGVALVPASATALRVDGVVYKPLTDVGGGHPDSDPARPVELHAIWARHGLTPLLREVLELVHRSAEHLDDLIGDGSRTP